MMHIAFIGRLETEKGIEIVLEAIKRSIFEKRNIIWHICGNGSYLAQLRSIDNPSVLVYWQLDRDGLDDVLKKVDLVLMPSLFLETFWLVALETLTRWIPVCWFARGWLIDFVHPTLALDPLDPVGSLFKILDTWVFPLVDISRFSPEIWLTRLRELTEWNQKILLVTDYIGQVGWAELYVKNLSNALIGFWKEVEIVGYSGNTHRIIRIILMLLAPVAFWRWRHIRWHIQKFNPDLIWMHTILRYVWPHGVAAVSSFECKKYITHHDLGLITVQPSSIYSEKSIPISKNLGDWIPKKIDIISIIISLMKWCYVQFIWNSLSKKSITHLVPLPWMQPYFESYTIVSPTIFPHTTITPDSVKG